MNKPVGPYSPFIKTDSLIFFSGQIGAIDGVVVDGGLEEELVQALSNLETLLQSAGTNKENVVKVTLFLTNMNDYGKVNETYLDFFPGRKPARSAVAVAALPLGAKIEIEAIATPG
jgi:2-iminobutanoate/2-iminopropanoate deaminase